MKFLTRSFLIDIALVAVACFTLVCAIGYLRHVSAQIEAGQHAYWVEIKHADGSVEKYRVDETLQSAAQLHEDIVQRMLGRPTPRVALMQWYQESSLFYAAASSQPPGKGRPTESQGMITPASAIRTVSTRQPDLSVSPVDPQTGRRDESFAWRDFWTRREQQASAWLASHEANVDARTLLLRESVRVTGRHHWIPSGETQRKASMFSMLVVIAGCVWRLACPSRSLHGDQVSFSGLPGETVQATRAAMCFRSDWVKARQPGSVIARSVLGWGLSMLAVSSVLYAVMVTT